MLLSGDDNSSGVGLAERTLPLPSHAILPPTPTPSRSCSLPPFVDEDAVPIAESTGVSLDGVVRVSCAGCAPAVAEVAAGVLSRSKLQPSCSSKNLRSPSRQLFRKTVRNSREWWNDSLWLSVLSLCLSFSSMFETVASPVTADERSPIA